MYQQLANIIEKFHLEAEETYFKDQRKIHFKDFLHIEVTRIIDQIGIRAACNDFGLLTALEFPEKKLFTPQAVQKASKKIPVEHLSKLNRETYDTFFKKVKRVLSIDGCQLSLSKSIKGFHLTPNCTYRKALLTTIYDLESKVPIAFDLASHNDERKGFTDLFHHVKPGDLLIFDRGYFSKNLKKLLEKKGCFYIFRLKNTVTAERNFTNARKFTYFATSTRYEKGQPIKEEIQYDVISNLLDCTEEEISDFYHKRWDIEEYFKFFKYFLHGCFYNFKSLTAVLQHLEMQFFASLLCGFLTKAAEATNLSRYYSKKRIPDLLFKLIYATKDSQHFIEVFSQHLRKNCQSRKRKKNRSFPRTAIINKGGWYRENK